MRSVDAHNLFQFIVTCQQKIVRIKAIEVLIYSWKISYEMSKKVLLNFPLPAKDEHEIKICSHNPVFHTTAMCLPWKLTKAATSICLLPACTSLSHPSEHVKKSVRISELHKLTNNWGEECEMCVRNNLNISNHRALYLFKITGLTATTTTSCEGPWRSHQYRRTTISTTQCTLSFSFIFISNVLQ